MTENVPGEIKGQLSRFQSALSKLEDLIGVKLSTDPKRLDGQLSPLHRSQLHLAAAQALHHTFLLYLRAQGQLTKDHPLNKESERLKFYAKKVWKLESADYLSKHKPTLEVNIAAANRFISHALPDLSTDQRKALKQTGNKRKAPDVPAAQDPAEMARVFLSQTLEGRGKSMKP